MMDPAFEDWINRAKAVDVLEVAQAQGAQLKKIGAVEWAGPCPICGGDDRFSVNTKKQIFNCRGSKGGGVIDLVMHTQACDFLAACETILNEPPPRRESQVAPRDPEIERERREERRDRKLAAQAEEDADLLDAIKEATALFSTGVPILGTLADDYLDRRGIQLQEWQAVDLRFVPSLAYFGFVEPGNNEQKQLGSFPAMIAAIRDVKGRIIGVHRTYLDTVSPKKLIPPGDRSRNKAKKVLRKAKGGMIRLGPIKPDMAIGEGIETVLSWFQMYDGPIDIGIATSVSLGNMHGASLETRPHPTIEKRSIPWVPDPAEPGIILPEEVRSIVALGDGDSDATETRAKLLMAGKCWRAEGREVSYSMAPEGTDWNGVLLSQARAA